MEVRTLYRCGFCETDYSDRKKCEECEKTHTIPKKVKAMRYVPFTADKTGHPASVEVTFEDGQKVIYKRY